MSDNDTQRQLGAALGRVPSGLFILTARRGNVETGMLASWVQQCSFDPPQITAAIEKNREIASWLQTGTYFTVNILEAGQTHLIMHFGRRFELNEPAFTGLEIDHTDNGSPLLKEALAYLDCEVANRFSAGDHDLFVGRVIAGRVMNEGQPMVHVRKSGLHY